jgi:hypothetical protein
MAQRSACVTAARLLGHEQAIPSLVLDSSFDPPRREPTREDDKLNIIST